MQKHHRRNKQANARKQLDDTLHAMWSKQRGLAVASKVQGIFIMVLSMVNHAYLLLSLLVAWWLWILSKQKPCKEKCMTLSACSLNE
jgi:hypothetical protein